MMNIQPLEFIDFSQFNFIPAKENRLVEDPLALDIKDEPQIKQELIDSNYFETLSNIVDCKKEPLDENEGVKDPLAFSPTSSPIHEHFSAIVNSSLPIIKEEPPDPEVTIPQVGDATTTEDWLLNSECGRIFSKNLPNILDISNNLVDQFTNRVKKKSKVVKGLKTAPKASGVQKRPKGRSKFYCFHCNYVAYQKCHITVHIIAVHGGVKPFSCQNCNLKFVQKGSLNRHILVVHNREKPYKCDHCDFSCGRKEGLKNHKASMHDSVRPYACSECSFKAVRKNHLVSHVNVVHKKVKPFTCNMCSYAGGRKIHLENHINSRHRGIKQFSCIHCSYKTNIKGNLKQHVDNVHNKLKPFICHHCDHRTNHKGSLRGHMISFHLSKKSLYGCTYCHIASYSKKALSKHIKNKHKDSYT